MWNAGFSEHAFQPVVFVRFVRSYNGMGEMAEDAATLDLVGNKQAIENRWLV